MSIKYSDEIINAYVDGELDGSEKQRFRLDMECYVELADRVHALCRLKKALKNSYQKMPVPIHQPEGQRHVLGWAQGIAALLLLFVGAVTGWLGHGNYDHEIVLHAQKTQPSMSGVQLNPVNFDQSNKIILHIASSDDDKLNLTLAKLEAIINQYKSNHMPFEVEVIANAGGVNLLRADFSTYQKRIASITQQYNNVSFIACSNALERLRLQGIEPHLIKNVKTGVTAVEQIIKRLQQGWVYMKV